MKKGNQQTTKALVMMKSVLAAFLSRFESAAIFFRRVTAGRGEASIVDGSGSRPLWYDVFSGDVFVELTFVNAVVVVSANHEVSENYFFFLEIFICAIGMYTVFFRNNPKREKPSAKINSHGNFGVHALE